jgi:hypothetical protein
LNYFIYYIYYSSIDFFAIFGLLLGGNKIIVVSHKFSSLSFAPTPPPRLCFTLYSFGGGGKSSLISQLFS